MDIDENQEPKYPLDSKSYIIIEEIGRGTSSIVYRAFYPPLNTHVAIKSINLDKSLTDFDSIISTPSLDHKNILNSHCTFIADDNKVWVVMPLMSAGSLQSIMSRSFPNGLPESYISVILKQTLKLLSYLHSMKILNMELKAENILIDINGPFKFSDFGLWCSSRRQMKNISGNPYWIVPELIESSDGYSMKSVVWSFGILALELAHGKPPLSDIPLSKSMTKKIRQRFSCSNYIEDEDEDEDDNDMIFSKKFKSLVKKCLKLNPDKRPTLEKLRKHRFFKRFKSVTYQADEMFKLSAKIACEDEDDEEEEEKEEKWDVISGWNLNVDIMKLFPFYSDKSIETSMDGRRVQFGDITVIEDKVSEIEDEDEDEDEAEEEEEEDEEVRNQLKVLNLEMCKVIRRLDEVSVAATSKEKFWGTVFTTKNVWEEKLNQLVSLITAHKGILVEAPIKDSEEHNEVQDDDDAVVDV